MSCVILTALDLSMATTQLSPATREVRWPVHTEQKTEYEPLRMNWVVVTDKNGKRHLRMRWNLVATDV